HTHLEEEVGEVVGRRRHVRQVPDDGPPLRGDSDGRGSIQSDWINRPATALSAASAFRRWSSAVSPPFRCGTTTSSRSGTPCRRACVRAAVSKLSQTIVTVWRPRFSRAAASSTLPDVHDPQSPMPTTATAAPSRAASISSGGEGAVPDGFTSRRTLAPRRSVNRASRWVVNGMSRLSSTRAIVAPWSVRGRDLGGRWDGAAGQTGLRISIMPPRSPRAPDRAGDGEAAEAAPPREHRGEVAPAAGHDDVDVLGPGGDGQPGGRVVEVVAVRIPAGVPFHFPKLLVNGAAGAHVGERPARVLPEVGAHVLLGPTASRELLGVERVERHQRLPQHVDVVVAEGAERVDEH